MEADKKFWEALDILLQENEVKIDRAKGSAHPRYPDYIYPFDYGYVANTTSTDGAEIDIWQNEKALNVTGVVVTFDPIKKDSEMKILLGFSEPEAQEVLGCHRRGDMQAILVMRT